MRAHPPEPHELDPIEVASRDEIAGLQLARLRATLRHAYERVAHYREAFDRASVRPEDLRVAGRTPPSAERPMPTPTPTPEPKPDPWPQPPPTPRPDPAPVPPDELP